MLHRSRWDEPRFKSFFCAESPSGWCENPGLGPSLGAKKCHLVQKQIWNHYICIASSVVYPPWNAHYISTIYIYTPYYNYTHCIPLYNYIPMTLPIYQLYEPMTYTHHIPSNYIAMISQPDLSVTPWDPPADPGAERCRSLQSAACASPEEAQRRRSAFSQAMSNTSF